MQLGDTQLHGVSVVRIVGIVRLKIVSGAVQLPLFSKTDLAEIRSDAYPGEHLVVCYNKRLAFKRKSKSEDLLESTEKSLDSIVEATKCDKRRLQGIEKIELRVGKVIGKYKMAEHFEFETTENSLVYRRKSDSIATESALDGTYIVLCISMPADELDAEETVYTPIRV